MANANNAYATVKPIDSSISDFVYKEEASNLAYIKEQRLADAEKETKKEKEKASAKKSFDDPKLDYALTNYSNHDEPMFAFIDGPGGLFEQNLEISKQLEKTPNDVKLRIKKNNIEKAVERIDKSRKGIIEKGSFLSKGLQDNTLSKFLNKNIAQDYNKLIGGRKYEYFLDENGQTGIKFTGKDFDRDGDGLADTIMLEDHNNPEKMGDFKKRFDDEAWLTDAKKRYGSDEKIEILKDGYTTRESKGFNNAKLVDLSNEVDALFGKDYKSMSDSAKSLIGDRLGLDPEKDYDEDSFKKLRDEFKTRLVNSYETIQKETVNFADKNADNTFAQRDRQFNEKMAFEKSKQANAENLARGKAKAKGEATPEFGESVVPSRVVWGLHYPNIDTKTTRSVPVDGKISLRSIMTGKKDTDGKKIIITDPLLENYTYNTKGRMIGQFSYVVDQGVKSKGTPEIKKSIAIEITRETESEIAKQSGVTVQELKNKAKGFKKYSSTQESAINAAMKSNPGYSREEITSALKM